ncbi:MAG: PIN domain nuclease [Caldilineaceae bacterium]|nr:PIN domain nuclease [Caldilineaceae bacterium]MBP8107715.1 PIN domain nuclease [Caldilineaceae bacterium]MBP8122866.1 PIN domain nuclease [Caldilineaceae bacterium]MBP9071260.1 PIN domain nuclease [Caldilineaceae bacterium]
MAVLVDTSVWIDLFRGQESDPVLRLRTLLADGVELVIGDLILTELLQGVRHESELRKVETAFAAYRVEPLVGEALARRSAYNYRLLRTQGITIRKTIDCLIATWCIENRVPLLHNDRDFLPFERLGLQQI